MNKFFFGAIALVAAAGIVFAWSSATVVESTPAAEKADADISAVAATDGCSSCSSCDKSAVAAKSDCSGCSESCSSCPSQVAAKSDCSSCSGCSGCPSSKEAVLASTESKCDGACSEGGKCCQMAEKAAAEETQNVSNTSEESTDSQ